MKTRDRMTETRGSSSAGEWMTDWVIHDDGLVYVRAVDNRYREPHIEPAGGVFVCDDFGCPTAQGIANALLILAAPEMC